MKNFNASSTPFELNEARDALVAELRTLGEEVGTSQPTTEQLRKEADLKEDIQRAGSLLSAKLGEARDIERSDRIAALPTPGGSSDGPNMFEGRALLGSSATDGAELVPDPVASLILDQVVLESDIARRCTRYTMTSDQLLVPRSTTDAAAAWTAEGDAISSTEPQFDQVTLTAFGSKALDSVSNELIADSNPDVLRNLTKQHIRAHARALEAAIINGNGTSAPLGLRTAGQSFGDTDLANNAADLDDFLADIETLATAGNPVSSLTAIMHPRTWFDLIGLKRVVETADYQAADPSAGVPASLFGIPVLLSSNVSIAEDTGAESYWIMGDLSHYVIGVRKDVELTLSTDYGFNTDTTAVRSVLRVAGKATAADAFTVTDGIAAV